MLYGPGVRIVYPGMVVAFLILGSNIRNAIKKPKFNSECWEVVSLNGKQRPPYKVFKNRK